MPASRVPHRALFADTATDWCKVRGGQIMAWCREMKSFTKRFATVGRVRLPDWGPRDSQRRWLETLGEMAASRAQWRECCRCLSELSVNVGLMNSNPVPASQPLSLVEHVEWNMNWCIRQQAFLNAICRQIGQQTAMASILSNMGSDVYCVSYTYDPTIVPHLNLPLDNVMGGQRLSGVSSDDEAEYRGQARMGIPVISKTEQNQLDEILVNGHLCVTRLSTSFKVYRTTSGGCLFVTSAYAPTDHTSHTVKSVYDALFGLPRQIIRTSLCLLVLQAHVSAVLLHMRSTWKATQIHPFERAGSKVCLTAKASVKCERLSISGLAYLILESVDSKTRVLSCYFAGGLVVGSVYWSAVTYGAITVMQVLGHHQGLQVMENMNPLALLVCLPTIPICLILAKAIPWENFLQKLWRQYISRL
ncbi:uncharacterized protein DEA37_0004515, partial [Paragonimus westermani]